MKEQQGETCLRRMTEFGPWEHKEGLDGWHVLPNGDRTCTFCGSLHPDDVLRLLDVPEVQFTTTDKSYKFYVRQPGVANAREGGIKFYVHHVGDKGDVGYRFLVRIGEAARR